MSRDSSNEIAIDGSVKNGYDYRLQVWVENGVVLDCGHPHRDTRGNLSVCCSAKKYVGLAVNTIDGHMIRGANNLGVKEESI